MSVRVPLIAAAMAGAVLLVVVDACTSFSSGDDTSASDGGAPGSSSDGGSSTSGSSSTSSGSPKGDAYRNEVMADKPIAYFRLEELTAGPLKNEVDTPGVSAVVAGAVTLGAQGIAGTRGVRLDDRHGQVNVSGAMKFVGTQPFTIEAWVEISGADAGVNDHTFLFTNIDETPRRFGQWMFVSQGRVRTETWADDGTDVGTHIFYTTGGPLASTLEWVHAVFFHDGVDDILYTNGSTGPKGRIGDGGRPASTLPLSWTGFIGRIDEIAIYDKVLPIDRINNHYSVGAR